MNYADLIERALSEVRGADTSLAALLRGMDALNKSVPTLEELNDAFPEVQRHGHSPSHDWQPIDRATYERTLAKHHEWMAQTLEALGSSRLSSRTDAFAALRAVSSATNPGRFAAIIATLAPN